MLSLRCWRRFRFSDGRSFPVSYSESISRTAERIASLRFGYSPVSTICSTSSICCFGIRSVTRSMVGFPLWVRRGRTVTRPFVLHSKTALQRRGVYHATRCVRLPSYARVTTDYGVIKVTVVVRQWGVYGGKRHLSLVFGVYGLSRTSAAGVRRPHPGQNAQSERSSSPQSQNTRWADFSPQFGQ